MSGKHKRPPIAALLLLLLLLALTTAACQTRQKGRKPSPDWSRSIPVGVLVRGDIDLLTTGPDPRLAHLVWLQEESDRELVHYTQLATDGELLVDHNLALPAEQIRYPQLAPAQGDNLHLLWSSRGDGRREWDLWAGQLTPQGELAGSTLLLAPAAHDVREFNVAADGQGGLYVAWSSDADEAIYGAQLSATGMLVQEPVRLVNHGADSFVAHDGTAPALVWFDEGDVRYARFNDGILREVDGETVTTIPLATSQILDGPVLGLSGDWAYVLWSVFSSSGLEAGTAVSRFVSFPKDTPSQSPGETIRTLLVEETPYEPVQSAYQIGWLAPPADVRGSASLIRQPNPTSSRGDELAVAVALDQESRLNSVIQTAVLLFKDGAYRGYQMAGKTEAFSQDPVLATDSEGNLYMAWREGGRGSLAYYAVTADEGRDALDRMSGADLLTTALSGSMELIAGMLFFPLACIWLLPGLLLVGVLHIWGGESDLSQPLVIGAVILGVLISQAIKFAFLPTISFYVPFSAWLDIAPAWEDPLRILAPFITLGIGLIVALFMRRRNPSALAFAFWLIGVDALLTLAIYGVNFLGVF